MINLIIIMGVAFTLLSQYSTLTTEEVAIQCQSHTLNQHRPSGNCA